MLLYTVAIAAGLFVQRRLTRLDIARMADADDGNWCRWFTPEQWRLYVAITSKAERRSRRRSP